MNSIYIVLCLLIISVTILSALHMFLKFENGYPLNKNLLIISVTILSALYMILKFENGYPLNKNDFNELYKNIEEKIIALLEDKE